MKAIKLPLICSLLAVLCLANQLAIADVTFTVPLEQLLPMDILKLSQEHYNSLTNYSDQGQAVSALGDTAVPACNFSVKLGRPHLYKISWDQNTDLFDQKGLVWSTGLGDFLETGTNLQKEPSLTETMGAAAGFSSGATVSIPGAFFHITWANPVGVSPQGEKRLPDAAVDAVDCFVLTRESHGTTTTLWIGKQDFFVHQVQRVTSADVVKARLAEAAKDNTNLTASLLATDAKPIIATETHTHILVNQNLSPADFDHAK